MMRIRAAAIVLVLLLVCAEAEAQPSLVIQGAPYYTGDMTLTVMDPGSAGEIVWLLLGLDPLPWRQPVHTAIGSFYMGTLLDLLPLAFLPGSGRLDVPFNLGPAIPGTIGIPLLAQAYVEPWLSNPATIPLDLPYLTAADSVTVTSPQPVAGAMFGEQVAVADLNGDGSNDIIAGAWREAVSGKPWAGRAYVLWGPDFDSSVTLSSPTPIENGFFGERLGLGDVDGDGQVDLLVPEMLGVDPVPPTAHGHLYVYFGGPSFSATPDVIVQSSGGGPWYQGFGRRMAVADFNDDGLADVAIGLTLMTVDGYTNAGKVEVYWGPTFGSFAEIYDPEPFEHAYFGDGPLAHDVTGDGIDDLILGTQREDAGGVLNIGRVHVFAGPDFRLVHVIENPLPDGLNSRFGTAVGAIDIDADGLAEILVTDERDHAYVFWSPSYTEYEVIDRPPAVYTQSEDSDSFGYDMRVGDVNRDGWPDLIINDSFDGSLSGCTLNLGGGTLFVALGPYYATHVVVFDPTPQCLTEFGWTFAMEGAVDDAVLLAVGNHLAMANGLAGAGKIIVYRDP